MSSEQQAAERGGASDGAAVSVVVPVFDEERALPAVLEALRAALQGTRRVHEIVVVDDGSTDATAQILSACADITVIRHSENRGYGAALKSGIRTARHPLIVVIDADGTYPVAAIPGLVDRCATADMVVAARIGQHVHSEPARSIVKWCFRQFAQWLTGAAIPDLNSGLRVFNYSVGERFMALFPDGFSFTTTITVAALVDGLVVRFEPVDYLPRIGRSKVRPLRDTVRIGRQLLWLGWRVAPLRTLAVALLPLFALGIGSSAHHLTALGHLTRGDIAVWAACTIGLAIGMCAEHRARRRRWSDVSALTPIGE